MHPLLVTSHSLSPIRDRFAYVYDADEQKHSDLVREAFTMFMHEVTGEEPGLYDADLTKIVSPSPHHRKG